MRSKFRLPGPGKAFCAAVGSSLLLAGAPAHAESTAHPAAGALRLPNIRLEMATPRQLEQAARIDGRGTQGMRAYINPETNELRDQTPEEMLMTPEAMGKARGKAGFAKALTSPSGGVVMETDESVMSFSVVGRDSAGRLGMQCVAGPQAAAHALGHPAKGGRHDH